jgi:tetratricopeptide (TPR) repeat protein
MASGVSWLSRLVAMACVLSVLGAGSALPASSNVRAWEEDVVMPSYRLDPPDKNPMFYRGESYQGAQKRIYPYPFQEHVTNHREDETFRFVFLENEFIKVSILPEIGGRLFSALDRTNGYEIFYHQSVIKPALIGMLGAWISGGIEWCVFHHHRDTTHMPVDYTLVENPDGSATVWFGETERRHRMRWLIGITLHPGQSLIEATVRLFNRTPTPHSMLYWANVAVHSEEDYQIIFPPSVRFVTYHSKIDFARWPVADGEYRGVDYRGVDLSWWRNHPEPISFFAWDLREEFMGGYDHGRRAGVAHVGNHHIVSGAKLWEWGPGPRGRMWDRILTDTDGPYTELMVGAYSDNQPDYSWIKPYEVRSFQQYWFPIREIGGIKNANRDAAVNLELNEGRVLLGFNTTSSFPDARIVLEREGAVLFERRVDIGPAEPFLVTVDVEPEVRETDLRAVLRDRSGATLIEYRPRRHDDDSALPDTVKPPPPPEEVATMEELYLTGLRLLQMHSPTVDPQVYFEEALRRDSYDARTNTVVGLKLLRRGLYERAEEHLRKAVGRLSAGYTRPYDTEAHYYLGLAQKERGQLDEAYRNFYRASWDYAHHSAAYHQLAEISAGRGELEEALKQIERSLSTNRSNTKGLNLKAAILRRLGRTDEARDAAGEALALDPLDFLALSELGRAESDAARVGIDSTRVALMRGEVQSYLELATDYMGFGFWDEAADTLRSLVASGAEPAASSPLVHYYLGYLHSRLGDSESADRRFRKAAEMSPDYCFPFRLETGGVLRAALRRQPEDARAWHYLGNLLYEIQPEGAIKAWERSRELDPAFARNHRNLGWAYYRSGADLAAAIESYEKAIAHDGGDPRFFSELDELYERANVSPERRLALLEEHHATVIRRNYSFVREIMAQVLTGNYDRAIEHLRNNFFHIREGGGEIHGVHVDAHLLRGLEALESGRASDALEDFLEAATYPENLSVGVPRRDRRAPQVAYYTALAHRSLGRRAEELAALEKAAGQDLPSSWAESQYYRALALAELGRAEEAAGIFERLIEEGERRLEEREVDFFAKFGEQATEQAQRAEALYILGLGLAGAGDAAGAEAFRESVALDASNVWAGYWARRTARRLP